MRPNTRNGNWKITVLNRWLTILFFAFPLLSFSQTDKYVLFFADKENSPYSVSRPNEFLSEKALERRMRQGISVEIEDLPVNDSYIMQVAEKGIRVRFATKWMNAIVVDATAEQVMEAAQLPFVSDFEYVAPGTAILPGGRIKDLNSPIERTKNEVVELQRKMLGVNEMHQSGFQGEGITIAILDAGFPNVDTNPYFAHVHATGRIKDTYNYIRDTSSVYMDHWHGAVIFSMIAADFNGFTGVAPGADYLLYTTEDGRDQFEYRIEEYNWVVAAERADSAGADIITSSLGYTTFEDPSMNYSTSNVDGNTAVVTRATNIAFSKGMLTVSSAGNSGNGPWQLVTMPADAANNLSVGAIDENGKRASFSSIGPTADGRTKPDVMAMGAGAVGVSISATLNYYWGTSLSAPQVAGLAAGLWQANPWLNNGRLLQLIRRSGDTSSNPDNFRGYGVPSYTRAITLADAEYNEGEPYHIYPNPSNREIRIASKRDSNEPVTVKLISRTGQLLRASEVIFEYPVSTQVVNIEDLDPGLYILQLVSKWGVYSYNVVRL